MPQSKEVHREYMRLRREKVHKGITIPKYDHDLTAKEVGFLLTQKTEDRRSHFPDILLPLGQAYYACLDEQNTPELT